MFETIIAYFLTGLFIGWIAQPGCDYEAECQADIEDLDYLSEHICGDICDIPELDNTFYCPDESCDNGPNAD